MNASCFMELLRERIGLVFAAAGLLFTVGAVRNWSWLCDPVGKPYQHTIGRKGRRAFYFAAGCILVICGVMIEFHS